MAMRDPKKTIGNLIHKQKTVYISSVDEDGFPHIRAMLAPRVIEGIHTFYFSTNTSSSKIAQYRREPKASIYFCDLRFFRGVMLMGVMEVLEDPETKKMIWETGDRMYYKKGVGDPDYCVLKITAFKGKYYSNFHTETFVIDKADKAL